MSCYQTTLRLVRHRFQLSAEALVLRSFCSLPVSVATEAIMGDSVKSAPTLRVASPLGQASPSGSPDLPAASDGHPDPVSATSGAYPPAYLRPGGLPRLPRGWRLSGLRGGTRDIFPYARTGAVAETTKTVIPLPNLNQILLQVMQFSQIVTCSNASPGFVAFPSFLPDQVHVRLMRRSYGCDRSS